MRDLLFKRNIEPRGIACADRVRRSRLAATAFAALFEYQAAAGPPGSL
jgi:hypothetical protein